MGDRPSFHDPETGYPPEWTTHEGDVAELNDHGDDLATVLTFAPPRPHRHTNDPVPDVDFDDDGDLDDLDDGKVGGLPSVITEPVVSLLPPPVAVVGGGGSSTGRRVRVGSSERFVGRYRRRWCRRLGQVRQLPGVHRELAEHWPAGARIVAERWWRIVRDERGKTRYGDIKAESGTEAAEASLSHWALRWARPPAIIVGTAAGGWVMPGVFGDLAAVLPLVPDGPFTEAVATVAVCSFVGVPYLGYLGRPDPERSILREPDEGRAPERVMDQITLTDALADLDISKLTKAIEGDGVRALRWIKVPVEVRDLDGRVVGWTADIGLPGVTVKRVGAKIDLLASNLGRDETDVFVDRSEGGTATEMTIFVARKRPAGVRVWAPAEGGGNVYRPCRVGQTPRGDEVRLNLWNDEGTENVLMTGVMGSGKSATGRNIAAGKVEDPYTEFAVIDFKASADYLELEPVCRPGNFIVDGEPADQLGPAQRVVDRLRREVANRNHIIRQLNKTPGKPSAKKATEALARMRIGLHPVLLIVDELPRAARIKGDEKGRNLGKEFVSSLLDLVSVARSVGIATIISMQRASASQFDTDLRALLQIGICHAAGDAESVAMTLGHDLVAAGYTTKHYTKADRGKAIVAGLPGGPVTCQFDYLPDDPDMLGDVVAKSLELRRQLRLFPFDKGGPATEQPDEKVAVVYDVVQVTDAEARIWSSVVAERLANLEPGRYPGWTGTEVTNALNAAAEHLGVRFDKSLARNVRIEGHPNPNKGYILGDLMRLYQAAEAAREAGPDA